MEAPRFEYVLWQQEHWPPPPRWRLALAFALATLVSTTVVGARLALNFSRRRPAFANGDDLMPFAWAWHHPALIAAGLPYSLALMAILTAHELGHYLMCRRLRIDATLPYFMPAPTLIGTFGAFIRIRSPFASRREAFDVGIAGPLAGMVLALPLLVWGLWLSIPGAPMPVALEFGWPPLARWLLTVVHPGVAPEALLLSPLARAAWVGMFVTMLNLLPAAQLDGGHMLYAWAPRWHGVVSWALAALLLLAGWYCWPGWYMWAAFIALMRGRHPVVPDDGRPMGAMRLALTLLCLALLAALLLPTPIRVG